MSPNQDYVDQVCREIRLRRPLFPHTKLTTIYFGGGTPSLLEGSQIAQIIDCFRNAGLSFEPDIEITLEVNPATLDEAKVHSLIDAGVNRVSLGCQSFNDIHLKNCNREHTAEQTLSTIDLIKKHFKNYSLDLLFALPAQDSMELQEDLDILCKISPPHISAYCLTVPDKHPMNQNRASEVEQTQMFDQVEEALNSVGLTRYELSNFSKPGFESRHNNLYWTDRSYWGVGLSAHSYKSQPQWGTRFWNPSSYKAYMQSIDKLQSTDQISQSFAPGQYEELTLEESITDFCHTFLRMKSGLNPDGLATKYPQEWVEKATVKLDELVGKGLLEKDNRIYLLSREGLLLSNQVFAELLFTG